MILAVAATLLAAVVVVRNAAVLQFAESEPKRAAAVWAAHPSSEVWLGLTEIGLTARKRGSVSAATLSRIRDAAVKSPLSPEPYLVRGVEAQLANDPEQARRAFLAAKLRDGRSIPARYFLAELYFRKGDVSHGLREIALLARMVPSGTASLAPYIATYAKNPRTRPELQALFRSDPMLENAALTALATDAANTDLVLDLAGPRGATPAWTTTLIDSLVRAGQYGKARAVWAKLAHVPGNPDALLFDAQFQGSPAPGPFNWTLVSSTLGLAERQPGGRLHVLYYGQDEGVLASQLLVLPAGRYRLAMRVAGDINHAGALRWTVTCQGSNSVIASLPLGDAARLGKGLTFDVPAGCAAQSFALTGHAPEIVQQTDLTISGLQLTREGADG